MNFISKIHSQYIKYYLVALTMDFILRAIETLHVYLKFNPKHLFVSELFGLTRDVFALGLVMLLLFPIYHFLHLKWPYYSKILSWFLIGLFVFLHITISEYFFYQLRPLDIFVFKHRPEEMAFSLNTAGFNIFLIPFLKYTFVLLGYLIIVMVVEKKQFKSQWKKPIVYSYFIISSIFVSLYFFVKLPVSSNLSINKSTFIYVSILKDWYQKIMGPDMHKLSLHYQGDFADRKYIDPEFPFLHHFEPQDKLSPFLNSQTQAPNLVIIIGEGLSDEFVHPIKGIHFMPFLDSLSQHSLYWDRFFTNGERSFAATPSILGSLPFGNIGFALLDQYPYHFSLVNILKENNYFTSFYYGQGAWFHGMEPFYKFNNIDQIVDMNTYHRKLEKVFVGDDNHFWGYNDMDLYQQYFITNDSLRREHRLDIIFTGTAHAPFHLKHPQHYHQKLDKEIESLNSQEDKEHFEKYRTYYTSLYNVDDAFRYFFDEFAKRPEYQNTIFIITGDHPMTEIPVASNLKKYHVPLIIYSPLLKKHETFHGLSSHLDVFETLLSYLHNTHQFKVPAVSTALGKVLSFATEYENENIIPIMNDNRQVNDFLYKGYFISDDNTLYKIDDKLEIKEYYDIINWKKIYKKLQSFRAASLNASTLNKLMPESYYFDFFHYKILDQKIKREKFQLGSEELILTRDLEIRNDQIYIDIEFKRWEHLDFTPQCLVRIYNSQGEIIAERIHELKSKQEYCQFHIPVSLNYCEENQCILKAYLKNKESHKYLISELKVTAYEKEKK